VAAQDVFRHEPALTGVALTRLLEWLDDGVDSKGETYLAMRRRLVSYFDRRNRLAADELADETLNRIGRTLEKDGAIATTPAARYCYTVAKFVLLEDLRHDHKQRRLAGKLWSGDVATTAPGGWSQGRASRSSNGWSASSAACTS
jgi:hypothetical protein